MTGCKNGIIHASEMREKRDETMLQGRGVRPHTPLGGSVVRGLPCHVAFIAF